MPGKNRKITAIFEIVTPMFIGDADHQASRIRETSIKGALAFWWRALNYARFVGEAEKPDSEKSNKERRGKPALKLMQMDEQELFGGGDCGQSGFLIKVEHGDLGVIKKGEVLDEFGNKKQIKKQ